MKLSLDWLRTFVDTGLTPERLAERLTAVGLAVDGVERSEEGLAGVVVGEVISIASHPGADRLSICTVRAGESLCRVVCGAANVRAGGRYPFAPIGAKLVDGKKIRAAKIRGERSEGMLCSASELGLGDDAGGLLELAADAEPGRSITELLPLGETVLELDVPYNRPDWLSVRGVAHELAAATGSTMKVPAIALTEGGDDAGGAISVAIDPDAGCPLYGARIVRNVRVGPSPDWLRRRLESIGQRSINNVVDATNIVLHGFGQPIHAFDLATLKGAEIRVRRARGGETLETLDGVTRTLDPTILAIADATRPVALAGIMGGSATEVRDGSTDLLLESAHFDPIVVREGARRLGMTTDASTRFGRGIDGAAVLDALDRTAALVAELSGGTVAGGRVVAGQPPSPRAPVDVRLARLAHLLGRPVDADRARCILDRLGFRPEPDPGAGLIRCHVPSWRQDVEREEDLIEEIARHVGYDAFEERQFNASGLPARAHPTREAIGRSTHALVGLGFQEVETTAFQRLAEAEETRSYAISDRGSIVRLLNGRTEDAEALRASIWPGLLGVVRRAMNRNVERVRIFEHASVYGGPPYVERLELAGAVAEPGAERHWSGSLRAFDLFALKGCLEAWGERLGLGALLATPGHRPPLERGEAFEVLFERGIEGVAGRIAPAAASRWAVPEALWLFALDFEPAIALTGEASRYKESSRYPPVKRDLALVVPARWAHGDIMREIQRAGGGLVTDVRLFDVYEGPQVPDGHRSLAYALVFQSRERSLESAEVDRQIDQIVARLAEACGAVLRDV